LEGVLRFKNDSAYIWMWFCVWKWGNLRPQKLCQKECGYRCRCCFVSCLLIKLFELQILLVVLWQSYQTGRKGVDHFVKEQSAFFVLCKLLPNSDSAFSGSWSAFSDSCNEFIFIFNKKAPLNWMKHWIEYALNWTEHSNELSLKLRLNG